MSYARLRAKWIILMDQLQVRFKKSLTHYLFIKF